MTTTTEKPYQEAAMWAYQFAGALTVSYDFKEGDIVPLLDVLSALAEGSIPSVDWPAVVPSHRAEVIAQREAFRASRVPSIPADPYPSPGHIDTGPSEGGVGSE